MIKLKMQAAGEEEGDANDEKLSPDEEAWALLGDLSLAQKTSHLLNRECRDLRKRAAILMQKMTHHKTLIEKMQATVTELNKLVEEDDSQQQQS